MDTLEHQPILVRSLRSSDLEAVIRIDARVTGRERREYLELKLAQNLTETGIKVSLGAELDGSVVGFLFARVYYGEFGALEPAAVLDTLAVQPDLQGQGVGAALFDQLRTDLAGLGVERLRTEVDWDDQQLLGFFHRQGFKPAARLCLDLEVTHLP